MSKMVINDDLDDAVLLLKNTRQNEFVNTIVSPTNDRLVHIPQFLLYGDKSNVIHAGAPRTARTAR